MSKKRKTTLVDIERFLNKGNFRPANHNSVEKQLLHIERTSRFFDAHPDYWKTLKSVIDGKEKANHGVSLRMLYFLCTKYAARKGGVFYTHNGTVVNLFDKFHTAMEARRLKHMDVFQRRHRQKYVKHGVAIKTTPAQQTFFEFAFRNGVLDFARAHATEIATEMTQTQTQTQTQEPPNLADAQSDPDPDAPSLPLLKKRKLADGSAKTRVRKKKATATSQTLFEPEMITF